MIIVVVHDKRIKMYDWKGDMEFSKLLFKYERFKFLLSNEKHRAYVFRTSAI